jgi:hypothetical protein
MLNFLLKYNKIIFLYVVWWMFVVGSHPFWRSEAVHSRKDPLILTATCRKYVTKYIYKCTFVGSLHKHITLLNVRTWDT